MRTPSIIWHGILLIAICVSLAACAQALQRGMLDNTYISTARPNISLSAKSLPLLTSCQGICNLNWTGVMGGLPIQMWVAVYGQGALAPMAIAAQAQVPQNWQWDSDMRRPFSVDDGTVVFNGATYDACTFIVDPAKDPFGNLVTAVHPDGSPQLWLVRSFSARFNFNMDKIILEYREPLPEGITSLTALPYGSSSLLRDFDERARNAFIVANAPADVSKVSRDFADNIRWQYMNQKFLGTVSKLDLFIRD